MTLARFKALLASPGYRGRLCDFDDDRDLVGWTPTVVGGVAATWACSGGLLTVTTDANDDDAIQFQSDSPATLSPGSHHVLIARASVSAATQVDVGFGWSIADTTILASAPTDALYARKDDGDTNWDLQSLIDGAGSSATGLATLDTDHHVYGIEVRMDGTVSGKGVASFWVDGVLKASLPWLAFPYDESVYPFFAVQNGEAAAKSLVLDYFGYAYG